MNGENPECTCSNNFSLYKLTGEIYVAEFSMFFASDASDKNCAATVPCQPGTCDTNENKGKAIGNTVLRIKPVSLTGFMSCLGGLNIKD
jgi:hypothetical protein